MPHSFPAILADATLEIVLVGAVAAVLVIALALTLLSRSGNRDEAVGSTPPPARATGTEQKKVAAPAAPDMQSRAPAQPSYAPPPPAAAAPPPPPYAQSAPAAPGGWGSGAPTPQAEPQPEPYAPPPAQPAPPPSVETTTPIWSLPSSPPAPASPAQQQPPIDAPYAPPPPAPAPEPRRSAAPPDEPEEAYPFAPSAGGASSDIDWDYMERERSSGEGDKADENAPAAPPASIGSAQRGDDRYSSEDATKVGPDTNADEKREELKPTAEELADIEPAAGGDSTDDERLRGITFDGANNRQEVDQSPATGAPSAADLQFTSFYPREVPAQEWQTLLVYSHVADALNAVRADALKFAEELGERPRVMNAVASQPVERGTTLTIAPSCPGVRFNPERLSLSWDEDWQRSSFRFQADESLVGSAAVGEITVYVGPLILAILKFGVLVGDAQPDQSPENTQQQTALPVSVFASYSHDDTSVVLACRNAYRALGMTVNIDVDALRSGDQWDPRLLQLIEGSDVFQLFWSSHAAASEAVQREWRYALAHSRGAGYIRPVYWEQPLVAPPTELANVHFAYIDLPR